MRSSLALIIFSALMLGSCQARAETPVVEPRVEVDKLVENRNRDQLFDASVKWLQNSFPTDAVDLDISDRAAGRLMGLVTFEDGAMTVVDTTMPLRITVTIEVRPQGYHAVFDDFHLPSRLIGKEPAPGKELDSALQTARGMEQSLADHLAASVVSAFPLEH